MYSPQLLTGPSSVAQALAKMERIFQQKEANCSEQFQGTIKNSDAQLHAHFIKENIFVLEQIINAAPIQPSNPNKLKIDVTTWRRFSNILNRVAQAKEGVSRQECLFVHQFWTELQKL